MNLLSNASATGDWVEWTGGVGKIEVEADTWGGATATPQFQTEQGNAVAMQDSNGDVAFTDNGATLFRLPNGTNIRISISGSPSGVYATAIHVGG